MNQYILSETFWLYEVFHIIVIITIVVAIVKIIIITIVVVIIIIRKSYRAILWASLVGCSARQRRCTCSGIPARSQTRTRPGSEKILFEIFENVIRKYYFEGGWGRRVQPEPGGGLEKYYFEDGIRVLTWWWFVFMETLNRTIFSNLDFTVLVQNPAWWYIHTYFRRASPYQKSTSTGTLENSSRSISLSEIKMRLMLSLKLGGDLENPSDTFVS